MPRKVLVGTGTDGYSDLTETPAPSEEHLQGVLVHHPELLALDDLGLTGTLAIVGMETPLASGQIDLLGVTRSGDIVLVEFKTGPQNPDFRHALAQAVDYGSDLWQLGVEDFDHGVAQRYFTGPRWPATAPRPADLAELAHATWSLDDAEHAEFRTRLGQVLATGDFHYVVAAQRFTPSMHRTVAYLNEVARAGRYFLVQMVMLEGSGLTAYSAQTVAGPRPRSASSPTATTNEVAFLEAVADEAYREMLQDLLAGCRSLGLKIAWGSKGASIRLAIPSRTEPLSIAWVLPDNAHWYGLRHVSLGYDTASELADDVRLQLGDYVTHVMKIPLGAEAQSKTLEAKTFLPTQAVGSARQITAAIEGLVRSIGER